MMYWLVAACVLAYGYFWFAAWRSLRRRRLRHYLNRRIKTNVVVPFKVVREMENSEQLANQELHGEQGYYE